MQNLTKRIKKMNAKKYYRSLITIKTGNII
jgi:hypothetical protein